MAIAHRMFDELLLVLEIVMDYSLGCASMAGNLFHSYGMETLFSGNFICGLLQLQPANSLERVEFHGRATATASKPGTLARRKLSAIAVAGLEPYPGI
jgi:hypothetical protein